MTKFKKILIILTILLFLFVITFFWINNIKKEIKPLPLNNNPIITEPKKSIDTSSWKNYTNNQLGFSIKIPLEVPTLYRCPSNNQNGHTPLETYEDNQNGIVYISAQYYYDAKWSQAEQEYIGGCDKITYTLKSLENRENDNGLYIASDQKPFLGWKIIISNIDNDDGISKYIKDNFGSGCLLSEKILENNGIYDIKIKGEDWDKKTTDLGNTTCSWGSLYKILYSPEKHKLMSVILGQECTFGTDPSIPPSYQCYDEEMIKSFEFE